MAVRSILERITAEEEEEEADGHSQEEEEEEEEGAAHSLKDVCDFGKPEPSPFSSRRVMYENEEVLRFVDFFFLCLINSYNIKGYVK